MGICEILTVVFIALKLIGIIDWNWFFVVLPEIIAFLLYALIIVTYIKIQISWRKTMRKIEREIERDFDIWKGDTK